MKVLVTGGTGMVGYACRSLCENSDNYVFLSSTPDLRSYAACYNLFLKHQPTHVLHLAAKVGGVMNNYKHNADFFLQNIVINTNVLDCARIFGVQKVISLLSCCIYPDGAELPLKEENLHNGEPHFTNFGYAYAKRMLEVQSRAYNQQYGTNFVCMIPTNIYGPNDNFSLEGSHVVPALIRKIHLAKINNDKAVLWGDGTPLRELTYSYDIADILLWSLFNYDGEPSNIGTTEEVSIKDIVGHICKKLDFYNVEWDTSKPNGQFRKPTCKQKFTQYCENKNYEFVSTSVKEGIDKTINWYLNNLDKIRT